MNVVTGMHRSGTSFICQVLNSLGADFGESEKLFRADKFNAKGYYENIDFVDVNNKMVLGLGTDFANWQKESNSKPLIRMFRNIISGKFKYLFQPSLNKINSRADSLSEKMDLLGQEYFDLWVKDPRFCLTLRSWRKFTSVNKVVFCFRNPSGVAFSLKKREHLPLSVGYSFWNYHTLNFFRELPPGTKVLLVNFDYFFHEQHQEEAFRRIGRFVGLDEDDKRIAELPSILDIRLWNKQKALPDMPAKSEAAYKALLSLYSNSESATMFDEGLREFSLLREL
ncbi:hypothetical protein SAMN05660337_0741 [Maridesulfovibrio ferrireducens]|uniref:Sulfotransferase family protein n=1 Tax=Maridesulfovibrio ferrireducens TaxID=246191 RepID=A0A1G9CNB4_9BACT|nr:hypothetical protein [Maridesulfovibrio ferrireducens]SDK53170.1 hypothetical protein SAMN05660337_0741 [Maridesulfovibrio ferrireducens]